MPERNPLDYYNDKSRYKAKHLSRGRSIKEQLGLDDKEIRVKPSKPRNGNQNQYRPHQQNQNIKPTQNNQKQNIRKTPKRKKKKHGVSIVLWIFIIAIMSLYAFAEITVDRNLHNLPPTEKEAINKSLAGFNIMGIQPSYVLLLGSDARIDDPDLGGRTDAIILARIDPNTKKVTLLSIPRDTMVEIPGYGVSKINAAYTFGGTAGAIDAVERLCNIEIDHCAIVNFEGLSFLIDSIGGIDVYLDERIDNPKAGDVVIEAGQQHINGAQALVMSRDRDYADGDYTRQQNQRKVIQGILDSITHIEPSRLPQAIEGVSLSLSTSDGINFTTLLLTAIRLKAPWANMSLSTISLPSQPAYIGDVSYVIADRAATAELISRISNNENIEEPLTVSSMDEDISLAWQLTG